MVKNELVRERKPVGWIVGISKEFSLQSGINWEETNIGAETNIYIIDQKLEAINQKMQVIKKYKSSTK